MQKGYIILDVKCFFSKGIIVKKNRSISICLLLFQYYFIIILFKILIYYVKFCLIMFIIFIIMLYRENWYNRGVWYIQ